jgi:transposase
MTYGDVKQRWLVVYSPAAYQRALKTVNKRWSKQTMAEHKAFEKLCQQNLACEADALLAAKGLEKKLKTTFINDIEVEAVPHDKGKGPPTKGQVPDFYVYQIKGNIASLVEKRTEELERKSCFILATNQLDWKILSDEQLLTVYKDQQKVERGFRDR